MPEIFSDYSIEKDAWNWWWAMNSYTNWRWYETMSEEDRNILSQIEWLSQEEANKILIPFLENKYSNNREEIDEAAMQIKIKLDTQKDKILRLMEKLTKRPIFNENFHIWYTTCKRCPYNRRAWEIWMTDPLEKSWRLRAWSWVFTHELLHFQTHNYYENEYPLNKLNRRQFNLIKESLTFLLNHEFPWVNLSTDKWYPQHQKFREFLENYWLSWWSKNDFEDLINFGCFYILKNKLLSEE